MRIGKSITAIGAVLALVVMAQPSRAAVVINEVYGGGGNSGSTYTNDFIELYNNGPSSVDLTGYAVQYASKAGTFPVTISASSTTSLTGSIGPGSFYLIQEAAGSGGSTALPTPDATGSISLASGDGAVRLLDDSSNVLDIVGYGAASGTGKFETAAAPSPSNTTSVQRIVDGVDTNDNSVDFGTGFPTPGAPNVVAPIPEPASLGILALGGMLLLRRRK